jgi:hypothetical protein
MSHAYSYPAICRQGGYTDSIFLHGTMSPLLKAFLEAASAQIQPRHLNQTSGRIALRAIMAPPMGIAPGRDAEGEVPAAALYLDELRQCAGSGAPAFAAAAEAGEAHPCCRHDRFVPLVAAP